MKNWLKKILLPAMALGLAAVLFTGCVGNNESQSSTSDQSESEIPEDITITIGLPVNVKVEDYETNALTRWLEEETGYSIDFITFAATSADYKSQIATRLDDLPDILWNCDLGTATIRTYAEDGYILDLSKYFADEKLSAEFWENINTLSEEMQEYVKLRMYEQRTGAVYAVPRVEYSRVDVIDYMVFINQKWLDALGLQMPTNKDELYDVLVAFRDRDPNGNGVKDEIPIFGFQGSYCGDIVNWIVNMFIYADDTSWFNVDNNGKLYSPFMTNEYREALKFIKKLNDEGLLPGETTFTGSHKDIKNYFSSGSTKNNIGIWAGHPVSTLPTDLDVIYDYVAMPLWGCAMYKAQAYSSRTFITDSAEYPEAAFKVLMKLSSLEGAARIRYGEKGVDWDFTEEGNYNTLNIMNPTAFTDVCNQTWGVVDSTILSFNEEKRESHENDDEWNKYKYKLCFDMADNFAAAAEQYNPEELAPRFQHFWSNEDAESCENERGNCQTYIKTMRSHFGAGVKDPSNDADWNEYIKTLNDMGIDVWMNVCQRLYDEINK